MEFRAARFDEPLDLNGHLALLPSSATCKGLFFNTLFDAARSVMKPDELARKADIPAARYWTFKDYPVSDFLKLLVQTAQVAWPRRPVGEGARRLGRSTYDTFLDSQVGRVVFGALGVDPHMVMRYGSKSFQIALNFGHHWNERVDEHTWHSHYEGLPIFIETHQVGILEGMLERCKAKGTVRVHMKSLSDAVIETRVEP